MPVFAYRGRGARGELVTGTLEAADQGAVADQLLNTGVTPVDIKATAAAAADADSPGWLARLLEPKVSLVDVMLFSRQMYTLLKAGVPILRALAGLQESATNPTLSKVIDDLRVSLDSGRELSASMRRHPKVFSNFYINLVRVGEMTGLLEDVFLRLFQHLEFEKDMRDRVKTALRYPAFVVVAMAVALFVVNIFVIPVFADLYKGFNAPLPLLTKVLVGFSSFTVRFWPLFVAAAFAGFIGFRSFVATQRGKYAWDRFKLRVPIAGKIVLKATLARFARGFALSIKSGVPIVQGLTTVANVVDNDYVAQRIEQMRDGVERGESVLRTAVTTGVFTPVVLQMIAVGDETGTLDDLMLEIAQMYEREVDYEIKSLGSQIEPILIVCLAVLVLILALGVLLPIWNLGHVVLQKG
jgi:MSHA biogenesis protein MshG